MLEINNLTKIYKGTAALNNINLSLPSNSVIGIVGPNGAGKTTLLKCITDLVSSYTGTITIPEHTSVGLVLDDLKAYKNRTLKFNLEYFRLIKGLPNYNISLNILKELDFDLDLINRPLKSFSYGMNQKVITSLSLISNPNIVLLDEPFRGLDSNSVASFKQLLFKLKSMDKLVLFSSHNLADIEEICDKVIVINKGNILDIIDAKVVGDSRNIIFSTSNNTIALEIISSYSPTLANDKISLTLQNNQWNDVVKLLIDNDIEVLSVNNNSTLLDRVHALLRREQNGS
ncbi:MAG: ABC transporter ATP-binding protein [Bacilli bacterium]